MTRIAGGENSHLTALKSQRQKEHCVIDQSSVNREGVTSLKKERGRTKNFSTFRHDPRTDERLRHCLGRFHFRWHPLYTFRSNDGL